MEFITINGKSFPSPDKGLTFEIASFVSGGKNAKMEFIGQKVGRDQYKIDSLQWSRLTAATWAEMLQEFAKFEIVVQFPDMVNNDWLTLVMYPGNRTAEPEDNSNNGLPAYYKNCKCNIIDCGRLN